MAKSKPFDFEFDISDLEVEEQSPSSIERVLEARRQSLGLPPEIDDAEPGRGEQQAAEERKPVSAEPETTEPELEQGAEGDSERTQEGPSREGEAPASGEKSERNIEEAAADPGQERQDGDAEENDPSFPSEEEDEIPADAPGEAGPEEPKDPLDDADAKESPPQEAIEDEPLDSEVDPSATGTEEQSPDPIESEEIAGEADVAEQSSSNAKLPSPDELLRHASSILNGADAPAASGESDDQDQEEEEEEIMAMPDPQALMDEARGEEDSGDEASADGEDDIATLPDPEDVMGQSRGESDSDALSTPSEDDLMSLPDPQDLMREADRGSEGKDDSSRAADRNGELPPPPPPPITIDDDVTEEDFEEELLRKESEEPNGDDDDSETDRGSPEGGAEGDSEGEDPKDPFGIDDGLDGFNVNLEAAEVEEDAAQEETPDCAPREDEETSDAQVLAVEAPKPSLLRRIAISATWAAAFVLLGLASLAFAMKQEILERFAGYDIDGSGLSREIQFMARQVLEGLNEDGLYYMKTMDAEVNRVAPDEIRIQAHVFAQLNRNLYTPIAEREFSPELVQKLEQLEAARRLAEDESGEGRLDLEAPRRPWNTLYRIAVPRYKVIPLRVSYRLRRDEQEKRWSLTGLSIKGDDGKPVQWPSGVVKERFDPPAYDVESREFQQAFAEFNHRLDSYVAAVEKRQSELSEEELRHAERLAEERARLIATLRKGAYFEGMAISGPDALDTRRVSLVVTETRGGGEFVKGVLRLEGVHAASKRFTATLDFKELSEGSLRGSLKVATVAFEGEREAGDIPPFFHPGSVSRIELMTDGHLMEGDNSDISLRLVRDS